MPLLRATAQYHFNPRPPCGGRQIEDIDLRVARVISIHAPRAGGDSLYARGEKFWAIFQSTPPVRGATLYMTT